MHSNAKPPLKQHMGIDQLTPGEAGISMCFFFREGEYYNNFEKRRMAKVGESWRAAYRKIVFPLRDKGQNVKALSLLLLLLRQGRTINPIYAILW